MTYEEITTHPDGTRTIDLDGKTYRAETNEDGSCEGCALNGPDRLHACGRARCTPDGRLIIWVPQQ